MLICRLGATDKSAEIDGLEGRVAHHVEVADTLRRQVYEDTTRYDEQAAAHSELQGELVIEQAKAAGLKLEADRLEAELSQQLAIADGARAEVVELQRAQAAVAGKVDSLQTQIEDESATVAGLEQELAE